MKTRTDFHIKIDQSTLLIDIATRNVVRLVPEDTVGVAARIMAEKHISSIVVTDKGEHPVGIVTERNMLRAMQSECPSETALRKVMSSPVITVPETITCLDAYQVCRRDGIRHLVIVDDQQQLLGVVSETDFRLHINLSVLTGRRQVATVMKQSEFCLPPEASLLDALNLMQSHNETCVIVAEAGIPAGIITERDIVRLYSSELNSTGVPVGEVMTSPILTIPLDSTINDAADLMLTSKVRHLIVVDHLGKVAGLLGEHDLTENMAIRLIDEKLVADGAFLHTLINTIPDMVWLKDVDGVYLACNQRFERFFGANAKDIVGKTDYDFMDGELADFFRAHDRKAIEKNGPSINEEWVTYADDGHRELLETIKTVMRDSQGKLIGVLGIAHNITERKSNEDLLRRSEEKYRSLIQNIPDVVWTTGQDGKTVFISDNVNKVFGYSPEEIYADPDLWMGRIHPEDILRVGQAFSELFTANAQFDMEYRIQRKDGAWVWIHDRSVVSYIDGGVRYADGVFSDVSKSKKAEHALAESESRFRALVENSPFCIHEIDLDGRLLSMNPTGLCMLKLDDESKIVGVPSLSVVSTQDSQRVGALLQDAINGVPSHFEFTAAGEAWQQFRSCFIPIRDNSGKVVRLMGLTEDITEYKKAEETLRRQKQFSDDVINNLPGIFYMLNQQGVFVRVNPAFLQVSGYSDDEILGMPALSFFEGRDRAVIEARVREVFETGEACTEADLITKSGQRIPYFFTGHRTMIDDLPYLVGLGLDNTDRKRAEANLRITASVFDNSQEAIVLTDADNCIIDVNSAFTDITGYSREEVLGRNPKLLSSGRQDKAFYARMWHTLNQEKTWRGEIWNRRKSGEVYAELLSISVICDSNGSVQRYVAVFSDITHLKAHEAELSRVAYFDALTGIPNRLLLTDRLGQAIIRAQRNQRILAVCYLDLDGFKQVNDQYGHEVGDKLLVEVTRRLQDVLRADDTLARLGGDEFVLLFNDLAREQESLQVLDRILDIVASPVLIGGHEVAVSASIGVTFYPLDDENGDTLLRHADQAMYVAKQTGRNRYHLYDSEHDHRLQSLHESRQRILRGLDKGEFELFYQPKIALDSGDVAGSEALIRWNHPERGLLVPAEFLPVIADSDMEILLGEWVMDQALAQLDAWCRDGLSLEVSVNISARHLQSPGFVADLERKLAKYPQLPRWSLQVEVLETATLEDIVQSSTTIAACQELGVNFALDDFGTGYSSLVYLRQLMVDTLKIDQTFVRGMMADDGDRAIVQGIVALAKTFGRKTVAEGVEVPELIGVLNEIGCMYGQGYGIAYPMPAAEFLEWCKARYSPV